MKRYSSEFRMGLAAITAAAICFAASRNVASAQETSATNAATPPPVAEVAKAPGSVAAPGSASDAHAPAAASHGLPYGAAEVVKMYQGGINKDIIVNYVQNTALPYHLTADQIIYLQSLGMPQEVTKAMILRDGQMQQQQQQNAASQQFYATQTAPPPGQMPPPGAGVPDQQPPVQVVAPSTPPPSVTVIGSDDYPVYDYGYPSYYGGWPYYYGGPVVIGGFGWGWGHGGYHGGGGWHGGGGYHGGGGWHGGGGGHGGGGHH